MEIYIEEKYVELEEKIREMKDTNIVKNYTNLREGQLDDRVLVFFKGDELYKLLGHKIETTDNYLIDLIRINQKVNLERIAIEEKDD